MEKTIKRIVDYSVKIAEPERIYIFGSMAKESHNVHSDLDLLIVVNQDTNKKQIIEHIKNFAHEISIKTDVMIYTEDKLNKLNMEPHSFISGVLKDAKIIYKKGL